MRLIGFDIGGTKCAVSLAQEENGALQILKRDAFLTLPNWRSCVEKLFLMAESLLDGSSPDACGFSCGGPLDADRGIVLSPPNLPRWDRVPLVELARERFHVPCTLENDANACALAEWRWGAGRGSHDMVFLTFGTGLGAGIIMNDQLIRGANGNAGEVGHVRLASFGPSGYGKAGSFEGFCSGGGIAQLGETLAMEAIQSGKRPSYWHEESAARLTAKDIADAARDGDRTALRVFQICGEKL